MNKDNDPRFDPVDLLIRDMTANEVVDWMVRHGLPEAARPTIERNLREQFKWHRLQGRLDRVPVAALIAEVWKLRQDVKRLEMPQ